MKKKLMTVAGATSIHVGESDKPNEDFWQSNKDFGVVALSDGVTRTRANGIYPKFGSKTAPEDFVRTVLKALSYVRPRTTDDVMIAMTKANEIIAGHNTKRGITAETVDYGVKDYFSTTGLVLCVEETKAIFGFVGDVIALHIPRHGSPTLLTRDQLHGCHQFAYPHFQNLVIEGTLSEAAAKIQRQLYQRKEARNKSNAVDPLGNKVGFGAFTGEASALDFVEISEIKIESGDYFILASDALRTAATINGDEEETIESYKVIVEKVKTTAFEDIPDVLINLIREDEITKEIRSDDATVVIIRID